MEAVEGIDIAEVHAQRSRAEALRQALRQALRLWLQQQRPSHSEVFGLWRDRPEDSVELQQALRAEWSGR
jgi:hypothetical protein